MQTQFCNENMNVITYTVMTLLHTFHLLRNELGCISFSLTQI